MYQTSNDYKNKVYQDSIRHLLKVYIDDTEVEGKYIFGINFTQELFSNNEFSLGSVVSQGIELRLHKNAIPNQMSKIYIESGITNEIVPIGYFNVDNINEEDEYVTILNLLDDMIKFEFTYDGSTLINQKGYATILEILQDICLKAGIELRFYFFFKYEQKNFCL